MNPYNSQKLLKDVISSEIIHEYDTNSMLKLKILSVSHKIYLIQNNLQT